MKNKLPTRWNQLINQNVVSTPYLLDEAIRQWGMVEQNVINHHNSYNDIYHNLNGGAGPIEKNPYIHVYKDDFDIKREILILSPFPAKYGNDVEIDYYYGDSLDVWYYFFGIENLENEENPIESIRKILQKSSFSITDVFEYAQRVNTADTNVNTLGNLVLNLKVIESLSHGSTIDTVFLLSGDLQSLNEQEEGNVNTLKGFYWILQESGDINNYTISGDITGNGNYYPFNNEGISTAIDQQADGIIWWIKYGNKKVKIVNLPNPSPGAALTMIQRGGFFERWVRYKSNGARIAQPTEAQLDNLTGYMANHPEIFTGTPTKEYRREVYKKALENKLDEIKLF